MSLKTNFGNSSSRYKRIELELSKSTIRTAERKANAYNYRSKEEVLQKVIGEGIDQVI